MEKERRALLSLLRSGLWLASPDDDSCYGLSSDGWEAVFRLARQQTVTGIAYRGLQFLPDRVLPPEPLLMRWTAVVDAVERKNREMDRTLAGLYSEFRSLGLDPVLQKGQGVAQLYEEPLLRECGDIDFYFNSRMAMELSSSYVRKRGIRVVEHADRSVFYVWKGVEVEHHSRLFDLHNPFLHKEAAGLETEYGYCKVDIPAGSQDNVFSATVPSPFLNVLLLDLHILKHALGWGIGLRQLCDMARACYRLHCEVDASEMKYVSRRFGLEKWNLLLHAFLSGVLGLPEECLPYRETARSAEPLLDIVWRGGNFGLYLPGRSSRNAFSGKLQTSRSFLRNMRFSWNYAPKEAFWIFTVLLRGQLR